MKKRRTFTPEAKSEMVLRVLREEEPLSQIASENGVHPNQLSKWKTQFMKNAQVVFQNEQKPLNRLKADYEKKIESLYT